MDRFEEMQAYLDAGTAVATEGFGLPEVVATGVAIVGAGAIYGTVTLADKILSKMASKAKKAYDDSPKVQKKRAEREQRRETTRNERAQRELMNKVIDGVPYPEWQKSMDAYQQKYGPIILKIHKECTDAMNRDLNKLVAGGRYKGFPTCFSANGATYEDIWFTANPEYPSIALNCIMVGTYFPEDNLQFWDESDEDTSLTTHEDPDVKNLATRAASLVSSYLKENNRIIDQHMGRYVAKLKAAGIPAIDWDSEHMSDEFALEALSIELESPKIKRS